MSYSNRGRALKKKLAEARAKELQKEKPKGDAAKIGPRARGGNAPNVAALTANVGNTKRKEILQFVGAVARSSRRRKLLLQALADAAKAQAEVKAAPPVEMPKVALP